MKEEKKELRARISETAAFLKDKGISEPDVCVVLGTGLNDYSERMENALVLPYGGIPNMQAGKNPDHKGQLVFGTVRGKRVILLAGRFHYYENHDMDITAFPARVMVALGVRRFIITNAAGCVNPDFSAGSLMLISDHINLSGDNPLIGDNLSEYGPRFPDMTYTYDRDLRAVLKSRAAEAGISLSEGVYCMMSGPCFETPAEIRFARTIGADAVGMSSVPEAIIANHAGREVIGISFLSNMAAGILDQPLTAEEVNEAAVHIQEPFAKVIDLAIEI